MYEADAFINNQQHVGAISRIVIHTHILYYIVPKKTPINMGLICHACIMVKTIPATSDRPANWNHLLWDVYVLDAWPRGPGKRKIEGRFRFFLCSFAFCEEQRTATERVKAGNPFFSACVCARVKKRSEMMRAGLQTKLVVPVLSLAVSEFVSAEKMSEFCLCTEGQPHAEHSHPSSSERD